VTATVHDITAPTKRELTQALANLNAEAAKISRRGRIGTLTAEYERRHEQIDRALSELLTYPSSTTTNVSSEKQRA